jgi:DNA polymerase III epsilon subunit-like protein
VFHGVFLYFVFDGRFFYKNFEHFYTIYKKPNKKKGKKISLKKAASIYLNKNIQMGKHSALEDAVTTMELYLLLRDEWEQSDEPFLLPPNQIRQGSF